MRHKDPKGLCLQWFGPQTGPQGTCVNAGLSAYSMNQDTFWSWHPGDPFPSGEMFDSWTNAPTKGLSNQGTIFDADLGAMQGGYYGAQRQKEFLAENGGQDMSLKSPWPTADQVSAQPLGGPQS